MNMFCYQCQETAKNTGCTVKGVCGKESSTANLQDLLIYTLKGLADISNRLSELGKTPENAAVTIMRGLFATITNANFDDSRLRELITEAQLMRNDLRRKFESLYKVKNGKDYTDGYHDSVTWAVNGNEEIEKKAVEIGVLETENEDIRSLRELLTYGLKGLCAYGDHAAVLGYRDTEIEKFLFRALSATTKDLNGDELTTLVLEAGDYIFKTMSLLDKANHESFGPPEITEVNIGVGKNPGILISGHDL